jgi:hypothetical protein
MPDPFSAGPLPNILTQPITTDTLPLNLNLSRQVNRQDPAMTNSHGQIWKQVFAALSQGPELFRVKATQVKQQMINILQLGSEKQFPTRRLATI